MPAPDPRQFTPIPPQPGTYSLILHLSSRATIGVGKLGRFTFPAGWYVYVGSALGSGGLAGRLKHHTRPADPKGLRPRWHIDYLRRYAKITQLWYVQDPIRREHVWAASASQSLSATIPAPGFGSSDCNCPTHLLHFPDFLELRIFQQTLVDLSPNNELHVDKMLTSNVIF